MVGKEQPDCPTQQRETDQANQYLQDEVADLQRHEKDQTTCKDDAHLGQTGRGWVNHGRRIILRLFVSRDCHGVRSASSAVEEAAAAEQ
jgi:hypothetical protein